MHIKPGTWESSSSVCASDRLCDPAALVSNTDSEPHIRNRRLSPGAGSGGGGGCGGCVARGDRPTKPLSPGSDPNDGPAAVALRREKECRGPHKGRGIKGPAHERALKLRRAERWAEPGLALLRPPPAFPVQDSPAKLQPAVSYASKVKAGPVAGVPEEERPAIGVLLQNQWGLSFISEGPAPQAPATLTPQPAAGRGSEGPDDGPQGSGESEAPRETSDPEGPQPATPTPLIRPEDEESNGKLLLSCRHLVEALKYHTQEWNTVCKQQKDPKQVVWYQDAAERPA